MSCMFCGKSLEQHLASRPQGAPVPRMPCVGLKAFYLEEKPMTDDAEVAAPAEPQTFVLTDVELRVDGKPVRLDVQTGPEERPSCKLDPRDATRARRALSRWIENCEQEAEEAWDAGRSGYIGRIKFCAFADDNGLTLRLESSISEDL